MPCEVDVRIVLWYIAHKKINSEGSLVSKFFLFFLVVPNILRTFAALTLNDKDIMARQAREKSGTGIYHVMLRGINRQDIFEDSEDYSRFIKLLYQMVYPVDDNGKSLPSCCVIYAYCLMTNHVHLLIRETSQCLADVVKRIGTSYAQYYNKKYQRFGHLFQDRFKSEPVNDNAYFFTLLRYIHQNPVAAGITKDVASYQWSSWNEYERSGNGTSSICNTRSVLKRMTLNDLRELVFELLPNTEAILDFDSGNIVRSDEEIADFLKESFSLRHPTDLQLYSRERQNDILREAKAYGGSIRQLSRMTGISFAIVRNA